jgi:hypothetical protein
MKFTVFSIFTKLCNHQYYLIQEQFKNLQKKPHTHQALVVHTYNSSYSGGSDQEDNSLKPARVNSS